MPFFALRRQHFSRYLAQAPLGAVTRHSIAHFLGAGVPDADTIALARPRLQHKPRHGNSPCPCRLQKVCAFFDHAQRNRRRHIALPILGIRLCLRRFQILKPLALCRKFFPALIPATVQDFAAIFCGHARTETVAAFANKVARLESTFHIIAPAKGDSSIRPRLEFRIGLIGAKNREVNSLTLKNETFLRANLRKLKHNYTGVQGRVRPL